MRNMLKRRKAPKLYNIAQFLELNGGCPSSRNFNFEDLLAEERGPVTA